MSLLADRQYPSMHWSPQRPPLQQTSGAHSSKVGHAWAPALLGDLPEHFLRILPVRTEVYSDFYGPEHVNKGRLGSTSPAGREEGVVRVPPLRSQSMRSTTKPFEAR